MHHKSLAILLKKTPWKESSYIVSFLTDNHGIISAIAQSAKKPASPFFAHLEVAYTLQIVYSKSTNASLYRLSAATLIDDLPQIPKNYISLLVIESVLEIYNQLIISEDESIHFFNLLKAFLDYLPRVKNNHLLVIWRCLLTLSEMLGFPIAHYDGQSYIMSDKDLNLTYYDTSTLDIFHHWLNVLPHTATLITKDNILDDTCVLVNKFIFDWFEHHLNKKIVHNAILQYCRDAIYCVR